MKILFITLLFVFSAQAQNFKFDKNSGKAIPSFVGEIKLFRGNVYRQAKGKRLASVSVGTKLYKDDTVITEDSSFVKIQMVDDTILTLSANSEFIMEDFQFQDKENRSSVINLVKGQMRSLVKNKVKSGDLRFRTRFAVMAVRGTELFVNYKQEGQVERSEFALTSGKGLVTDNVGKTYELLKSDRVIIGKEAGSEKSATERNQLDPKEFENLLQEDEHLHFYDVSKLSKDSPLYPFYHGAQGSSAHSEAASPEAESSGGPQKDWRQNLDKLNEQLKENQKKKNPFH